MEQVTANRPARILVVDDEPDIKLIILQKFRHQVRNQQWHFDFAYNGQEALNMVRESPDIDLILTDINMPVMDGLSLLREIATLDHELRAVVISAYGDLANIRSAMNLGAFDFVTKPIDLGDLESTIGKTLDLVGRLKEARRLQQHVLEAEATRRARSRFLADISQELRTPLNAILLYSDLIGAEAEEVAPGMVSDLRKIKAAGQHLLSLINDVGDLSKMEAGTLEFTSQPFEVAAMVAELADIMQTEVAAQGNRLEVHLDASCGSMQADITRIRQILFNVVSNAAKFTQHGVIRLEASRTGDRVVFRITDTGAGMTAEQVKQLFVPYGQLSASTGSRFGGAGMGLPLTLRLCELMGGCLTVTSEPGQGSAFTIELPAGKTPSPVAP